VLLFALSECGKTPDFLPEFEKYFKGGFSGVKACDLFSSRPPLEKSLCLLT
jgi:hypothetical protein